MSVSGRRPGGALPVPPQVRWVPVTDHPAAGVITTRCCTGLIRQADLCAPRNVRGPLQLLRISSAGMIRVRFKKGFVAPAATLSAPAAGLPQRVGDRPPPTWRNRSGGNSASPRHEVKPDEQRTRVSDRGRTPTRPRVVVALPCPGGPQNDRRAGSAWLTDPRTSIPPLAPLGPSEWMLEAPRCKRCDPLTRCRGGRTPGP